MTLVPSFQELVQQLAFEMTAPRFDTFVTVLTGKVFAPRRTITGMILAADAVVTKHPSAFHRLFSKAEWCADELGLAVFALIESWDRSKPHASFADMPIALRRQRARERVLSTGVPERVTGKL